MELARWSAGRPWTDVEKIENVNMNRISSECWGVWLSREELLSLLRRSMNDGPSESHSLLRLRALLGRLLDDRSLTDADLAAARPALPSPVFTIAAPSSSDASERLARINEQWHSEASWGGLSFQAVPLNVLP